MSEQNQISSRDVVIITDIGSVDPDDTFALILAATSKINLKGVVTTHHYPEKKAKIAKLVLSEIGRGDINVYVGTGLNYKDDAKLYTEEEKKTETQVT